MKFKPPSDTAEKQGRTTSIKAKVKSFAYIRVALQQADFGTIFTTPQSDDIYVITHGSWGDKSANKVVKSFKPDTPFAEIKGFSQRTKVKHGRSSEKKKGKEEGGYSTKTNKDI
jgi:hypothetical protein